MMTEYEVFIKTNKITKFKIALMRTWGLQRPGKGSWGLKKTLREGGANK